MPKTFQDYINAMLYEADKIAMETFTPGTPIYDFQQTMIRNAAQLRIAEYETREIIQ